MTAVVLVVGADRAPHGLADLGERLGAEVEWIDGATRTVEKAARRVRGGTVAAVVVLDGYMPHRHFVVLLAAARLANVPVAYGGRGGKGALGAAGDALAAALQASRVA